MEHLKFKAEQTAAKYVAEGLDETWQEAFELHMMGCAECVEEVEVWRAIKLEMPNSRPASQPKPVERIDWRLAASLMGAGVIGAAGGWVVKATTAPDINSGQTVVFNLPSVSRGADECTAVRLAPDTQVVLVRVPVASHDSRVVALDSQNQALPAGLYAVHTQPDGSQLVRLEVSVLDGHAVHLQQIRPNASGEPLGCLTAE